MSHIPSTIHPVSITVTNAAGADFTTALTTGEAMHLADFIQRHAETLTAGAFTDADRMARAHFIHLARTIATTVAGVQA